MMHAILFAYRNTPFHWEAVAISFLGGLIFAYRFTHHNLAISAVPVAPRTTGERRFQHPIAHRQLTFAALEPSELGPRW